MPNRKGALRGPGHADKLNEEEAGIVLGQYKRSEAGSGLGRAVLGIGAEAVGSRCGSRGSGRRGEAVGLARGAARGAGAG